MIEGAEGEELLVRYLLGELPEDDQALLEEVFFADDGYFEQLLAAEDELKYAYAMGILEPGRRERFEARFAARPGGRASLAIATALISTLSPRGVEPPQSTTRLVEPPEPTTMLVELPEPTIRLTAPPADLIAAPQPRLTFISDRLPRPRLAATWHRLADAWRPGNWRKSLRLPGRANQERPLRLRDRVNLDRPVRRQVTGTWSRLARIALVWVIIVLSVGLVAIIGETIKYRNQVRRLTQALSRDQGYRTQIDLEKRRANSLAEELEIERSRRLMRQDEPARQAKQLGQKSEEPVRGVASFILSATPPPGTGPTRQPMLQSGDAQRLRLQLNLKPAGEYRSYEALLKTSEGKLVSGQAGLQPARLGPIHVIALTLPAKIVPPGDYHLELKGINSGGLAEHADDYYFSIAKRD